MQHIPDEALSFFNQAPHYNALALKPHLLTTTAALKYAQQLAQIESYQSLGLLPLNDANDSNPYCYVSQGPASGRVLYLAHADKALFCAPHLKAFAQMLQQAHQQGLKLWELPELCPALAEPPGLRSFYQASLEGQAADREFLLCLYLQLLQLQDIEFLRQIAQDDNFFVREALAQEIQRRPNSNLLALAQALSRDPIAQVADMAQRALKSIRYQIYLEHSGNS